MYDNQNNPILDLTCKICNKLCKNKHSLSTHIFQSHKLKIKEYIDIYFPKTRKSCLKCGKQTSFRENKYQQFCSVKCSGIFAKENKTLCGKSKGRKQSKETIEKRIKNTDQKKKEETRKNTCLKKYGVKNHSLLQEQKDKISNKLKGRKMPRTKAWQDKIIKSKIKNGTTKHSEETKRKLKEAQYRVNNSEDPPVRCSNPKSPKNKMGHKRGEYNGLYYRSSYELEFIKLCEKHNIKIESAENKLFRCPYILNNIKRMYYPDFYLPDYNIVVEIKPESMLALDEVQAKIHACAFNLENFMLITEENLFNEPEMLISEIKNCF